MPTAVDTFSFTMRNDVVLHVDQQNFAATISGDQPVLLEFSAVWCAPCRAVQPHLEALATQYAGRVRIGKLDVDDNPEVAARFEVRSLPTMLMFRAGQVVGQVIGAVPRARLVDLVERALSPAPAATATNPATALGR